MDALKMRSEIDSLGEVFIPEERYYGAQTQRALDHFKIGDQRFPPVVIKAFGYVKKAAALVNAELGLLSSTRSWAIIQACDEIIAGQFTKEFPLLIWQSGSGTQSNMNVNEVIANRAIELLGGVRGSKKPVHPNDDCNLSQSSNDVFPTVMHLAAVEQITHELLPAVAGMREQLLKKAEEFSGIIKVGRTHLMDATPMTLGQEFREFASEIEFSERSLRKALVPLYSIALGGSTIGTGLNCHPQYAERVAVRLADLTHFPLVSATNKFSAIAHHAALIQVSASIRTLATSCMKMANDIRLLASGPHCGLGELELPSKEPGSSIMPGKINPTQVEALTMVIARVMGNDLSVAFAVSQSQLQLNVYKPIIIYSLLESVQLMSDACRSFTEHCLKDIKARHEVLAQHLENNMMLVTVLNPIIGYDNAAKAVQMAEKQHISLKRALIDYGFISAQQYEEYVRPEFMLGQNFTVPIDAQN